MLPRIGKWALSLVIGEAAQIFVWPILPSVGAAVMGWLQDLPWFYILVGSGLFFASTSVGLLRFSEWRHRTRAADKLTFDSVRVGRQREDEQGWATALRFGVNVSNSAMFPVQFRVAEMNTQFRERFPPKKDYEKADFVVSANGRAWFDDFNIEIPRQGKGVFEGKLQCHLLYGRPGKLRHSLHIHQKVYLRFNEDGDLEAAEWVDQ